MAAPPPSDRPDAGQTLEGLKRPELTIPQDKKLPVKIEEPTRPPLQVESGMQIPVTSFRITGQQLIAEEKLQALIADGNGKALTLSEIESLAAKITGYFKEHGYIMARAYVPVQRIENGVVELSVIPGRYDKIIIRKKAKIDSRMVSLQLGNVRTGAYIEKSALERAIWLVGDLSGVEAKATLEPGSSPGTSNLILDILPKGTPISGNVSYDNYGNRFTGKNEYALSMLAGNPFQQGDQLSLYGITTGSGVTSGSIDYQHPLIAPGGKIDVNYSRMQYTLGDDYANLNAGGTADILGVSYSQNVIRSRRTNLYWMLGYYRKALEDKVDTTLTNKTSNQIVVGLNGNAQDEIGGGGAYSWSLTYSTGMLNINSPAADSTDSQTAQTAGGFGKYNLNMLRQQRITDRLSLLLSFNGQLATKNLDSSEKMSLGGAYGVRAYPKGEASGDDGWLASAELYWLLPTNFSKSGILKLSTFIDAGSVNINHSPWPGAGSVNTRALQGYGVGLNWIDPGNYSIKLNYAWKLGNEMALSDTDVNGRLWIQVTKYF